MMDIKPDGMRRFSAKRSEVKMLNHEGGLTTKFRRQKLLTSGFLSWWSPLGPGSGVRKRAVTSGGQWLATAFLLLVTLFVPVASAAPKGLYSDDDQMLLLTHETINGSIYNRPRAVLLEFYSSWCGHCINYAPLWKKFAKDVYGWKPVVEIAAINCADEVNSAACRSHNIEGFPTLKYFAYMHPPASPGITFDKRKQSLPDLRSGLAGLLLGDTAGRDSKDWPELNSLIDTSLPLFIGKTELARVLVVEDSVSEKAGTGVQAVLDLLPYKDKVQVRRVASTVSAVAHLGVSEAPGVIVFQAGSKEPKYVSKTKLIPEEIKNAAIIELNLQPITLPPAQIHVPVEAEGDQLGHSYKTSRPHLRDIQSGIGYMLHQEVAAGQVLAGDRLSGLKGFVAVLAKYLPGTPAMRSLLKDLNDWLIAQPDSVQSDDYLTKYNSLQAKYGHPFPVEPKWEHCQGSAIQFRGYPCSLWTTFHTLTVSAFKMDGASADSKGVLVGIRNYVINLFGCATCGQNFNKESKNVENEVKKGADGILWLWKTHNRVNKRLAGENTEDPNFPKLQFPPPELCRHCRNPRGDWDDREVLVFMLDFYGTIAAEVQSLPYEVKKFENGQETADEAGRMVVQEEADTNNEGRHNQTKQAGQNPRADNSAEIAKMPSVFLGTAVLVSFLVF